MDKSKLEQRKEEVRSRNPIEDVVSDHVQLRKKGNWLVGLCPFHEETEPSFAVKVGGRHAHCFSCGWSGDVFKFVQSIKGCTFKQALEHLGGSTKSNGKCNVLRTPKKPAKEKPVVYYKDPFDPLNAIRSWPHMAGYVHVTTYGYGVDCGISRWEHPTKPKQFFPITHVENKGWFIGRGKCKLPVYNQDAILNAFDETVIWCEGEKAADCAIKLGLLGSTSAGGANGFATTDFSALAGRRVLILPDNGPIQKRRDGTTIDVGLQYAESVGKILLGLQPKAKVEILRLPGLPDGGDLVDWVDAQPSKAIISLIDALRKEYKQNRRVYA